MAKTSSSLPAGGNLFHNTLMGLNDGDFQHLTMLEKANLELLSNKQDSLIVDGTGTKYPTVDAVNAGIISGSTPDATLTIKGKIKLAGDLSGTADVPLINVKTINTIPIKGSGDIVIDKVSIGLGNVDNTSDLNKPVSTATQNALNLKENKSEKNQINGYAGLDGSGKIFSNQLPALAVTDTFVINSQVAMLALTTAETGDLAVRTDLNKTFILKGTNFSILSDWQELLTPTSAVTSVFGRSGAVVANPGDYDTSLVPDTLNKRYVTDANLVTIGNQSGVNTGDNSPNNLYAGLVSNATHTGDASGATVLTLATVNSNVGTFGDASNVAQVTVNGKGLTTATTNIPIQIAESQVTNLISDLAGKQPLLTNPVTGTGAVGQVSFWDSTSTQSGDNALFWNNTNKTLGIGTALAAGSSKLTVRGSDNVIGIRGLVNGTTVSPISRKLTWFTTSEIEHAYIDVPDSLSNTVAVPMIFATKDATNVVTERMRITNTGNVLVAGSLTANSLIKTGGTAVQYLMADGTTSTLTNPVTGTGTSGQVAFWNGTNVITGDTGLVFDSTTNILSTLSGGNYRVTKFINGTTASPSYEPIATYGFGTSFDAGLYGGNSLTSNNGMFLKLVVNSTTALNTPIDAMIIPATGFINIPLNVGIGTNAQSTIKLDIFGSKTTTYTANLTGPTNDFLRIANVHNAGGTDQYSALSLMVTGNNATNTAYANICVIQPTAANSASEFALTLRQTSGVMNEVMRAKTNGNIGIGTVAPSSKLDVLTTGSGILVDNLTLTNSSLTANTEVGLFFAATSATGNIRGARISSRNDGSNNNDLRFYTGVGASITEKAIITNAGNIGIGSSLPIGKLDVFTGTTSNTSNLATIPNGTISFANGSGATGLPTILSKSNDNVGLRIISGTNNTNANPDMWFDVRDNSNTVDFSTLTTSAFRFTRFNSTLIDVLRNGNTTFTGNISTIAATIANHVVIKSQLDAVVPTGIKLYKALITQTSTGAPTVTVLFNTIGAIVWTRTAIGSYVGTLSSAFTANKTMCFINNTSNGFNMFQQATANTVTLVTQDITGTNLDGKITNASITIEVYP